MAGTSRWLIFDGNGSTPLAADMNFGVTRDRSGAGLSVNFGVTPGRRVWSLDVSEGLGVEVAGGISMPLSKVANRFRSVSV